MKTWRFAWIVGATALTAIFLVGRMLPSAVPPDAAADVTSSIGPTSSRALADAGDPFQSESLIVATDKAAAEFLERQRARFEHDYFSSHEYFPDLPVAKLGDLRQAKSEDAGPPKPDLSYLVYYVYSEVPPEKKPAETVLDTLKDVPVGAPIEEIKRASDVFGLDFSFMKTVAKIESDFDPKQRTGSYIGLFQLSKYEFGKYGSGDITSPRDNAIAAAYKFITEAIQFEWATHKKPTFSDLYLIHQQGWQGAAEHVAHPERIAWESMCATDEGREKGEKWCKRAIWGNTLPDVKHAWKSVDKLPSGAFVTMWRERVDHFYARYAATAIDDVKQ
jgi:hypothetical protein